MWITDKAKGRPRHGVILAEGTLKNPGTGSLFTTERRREGDRAWASRTTQAKAGMRLENYGNGVHVTQNREWWAIRLIPGRLSARSVFA